MKTTAPQTAEEFFASEGYDENGEPINAPKSEYAEGDQTIYDLDRFVGGQLDDREVSGDSVEDIMQAAERTEALAAAYIAQGERAEEYKRDARELRQLAEFTARNTFRIHALFSEAFAHAVSGGHWHIAQAHLIDAVKSDEADYALKVASTKALAEIATFAGDTGSDFDGRWLAELAGIPLRTGQDLVASARDIESGVAVILVGTEHSGRKAFLEIVEMTPARRREVVTAVKRCLTRYLLENAIEKERKQRARNISLAELRALALIGCNDEDGWQKLTTLSVDEGNEWLAAAVDEALRKRVLSERTEERASQTLSELKKRLHRNAAPRRSSRRNTNSVTPERAAS
jgi:hypothetical protein